MQGGLITCNSCSASLLGVQPDRALFLPPSCVHNDSAGDKTGKNVVFMRTCEERC